jgi:aminopeptidase N
MTRRHANTRAATRGAVITALATATAAAFTIAHAQTPAQATTPAAVAPAPVSAPERFDFDRTPGRLSKDARPRRYQLEFDLDPAQDTFGGRASIEVDLRRSLPSLQLHATQLEAGEASVQGADGRRRALRIEADEATATWRLAPVDGRALAAGRHTLHLAWRGRVQRSGEGLFRVDAASTAGAGPMLFTQLEAVYARTLFPGFDEPAFRAVFEISVRAPRGLQVESNMPALSRKDARVVAQSGAGNPTTLHRFAPTPPMASYLVALTVGRFDTLEGRAGAVPLRILTAPGKREQARYALAATQQLLPYYGRYFGVPYVLPKLDQLAVPGVRNGAMEDWGLISYNEAVLLVDPARSGPQTQRWVYAIAAHEIAHQWFGNLVTAASWDEIWLNEAFATWMENKATDHFNPAWQVPLDVRRHLERALVRDAGTATRAIREGMVDESRVSGQFDNITYNKGGAVLSMLEQWLGPEVFQRGLASYMRERRYSNAAAGDLWHHLGRASGRDVTAVAASWTDQPGVPLVSVAQDCREGRTVVRLAQRRFAVEPGLAPQRWRIPVQLSQGAQQHTLLLDAAEAEHTLGACSRAPVLANAGGKGYYRVKYAAATQAALAAALPALSPPDRMALLSDAFALAQAGDQPLAGYLELLKQLPAVPDPGRAALYAQAGDALRFLDEAFAGLPAQARVHEAARALFGPELKRLGWDPRPGEPATDARQRVELIGLLARFGDTAVIAEAGARFDADAAGRTPLPAALRPGVIAAVGRHATEAQFKHLQAQLLATSSEEERWQLASALASAGTAEQADAVLALSLAGRLPTNIACELPGMVADAGRFGERAYAFTKQNFEALAKLAGIGPFGGSLWLLPNAAQSFHDGAQAAALLEDQQRLAGQAGTAEAARVAARIRLHAAVREREAQHMLASR